MDEKPPRYGKAVALICVKTQGAKKPAQGGLVGAVDRAA